MKQLILIITVLLLSLSTKAQKDTIDFAIIKPIDISTPSSDIHDNQPSKLYAKTFDYSSPDGVVTLNEYGYEFKLSNNTWWDKWGQSTAITLWQAASTSLNAMGDAYNHIGKKTLGHTLNATAIAMYLSGPFALRIERQDWFPYLVGCVLVRFELFNGIHNMVTGQSWFYVGDVALTDKFMNKLAAPDHGWAFAQGISVTLHVSINYKTW